MGVSAEEMTLLADKSSDEGRDRMGWKRIKKVGKIKQLDTKKKARKFVRH